VAADVGGQQQRGGEQQERERHEHDRQAVDELRDVLRRGELVRLQHGDLRGVRRERPRDAPADPDLRLQLLQQRLQD
jgi:hypothetical protein